MIIDIHTHHWSSHEQLGSELAQALRDQRADLSPPATFEKAMTCVDAAFVFGFRSERLEARIPNELVADFVARDPRRRIGIGAVDPLGDDALDQLNAAHDLGLSGITVSPACQGFHPVHSGAMRIYERCAVLGLPLFVTTLHPLTRRSVLEFGRPALWDEVAQSFPALPIVIGQLGYPWIDETLVMIGKHANLYADIAGVVSRPWQLYDALLSAAALGVMDKILFGSGFPFEAPARAIEAVYSINAFSHGTHLPTIPRSFLRSVVERDSLACLGIDADISTTPAADSTDDLADVHHLLQQRGSAGGAV